MDTLKIDFDSPKTMAHWEEIMNRINSGDMPPDEELRPKPADVARVAEWIVGQLREAEVALQNSGREEYGNTVRDLLGVNFDVTAPTGLPEDPDWHGFERIGSALTLSPAHVEDYQDYTLGCDEWRSLCGRHKDHKARPSNFFTTMLQKLEVNTEQFVDSLGPISGII